MFGHAEAVHAKLKPWLLVEERRTRERLSRQFLAYYRALADALNETDAALLVALAKREVGEDERA